MGSQSIQISVVDNDMLQLDAVAMGMVAGSGENVRGSLYFDNFDSATMVSGNAWIINYDYDSLYRLTDADYAPVDAGGDGAYFNCTYDAVGNRLTIESDQSAVVSYQYDAANRLTSVGGVTYSWDANGNLLNDGTNTYTYDYANRLSTVTGSQSANYAYNGLGDRLSQTVDSITTNYTLDLAAGLTQVLADGTNTYLYGLGRISQQTTTSTDYFLTDALGSVRQLTDTSGAVTLTKSYSPFGEVLNTNGTGNTSYGFTGEYTSQGLIYLRARYYDPATGRFLTRDTWAGDYNRPISLHKWLYVEDNPINFTDPSGQICLDPWAPSGFHLDPTRGCDYPEGSKGKLWWRKDPLGEDTAIIDMPWVDEQSQEMWDQYPNSCGAAALYMFLKGEKVSVSFDTLVQQLQSERPAGYDGYCCHNQILGADGRVHLPTPTPDPLKWCNAACVSAETLADVARKYYGLNIVAGDGWTHKRVHEKVSNGHPVLALIRSEVTTDYFGHFVVIKGFVDHGWTVVFNDSYPGQAYWDAEGGSSEQRRQIGEGRTVDWDQFDASWASSVDRGYDPLSPGGHVRWAMSVK